MKAALRGIIYGLSSEIDLGVRGLAGIKLKFSAAEAIKREREIIAGRQIDRSAYITKFEEAVDNFVKDGWKVLLFIDDVDRCLPDTALQLLEQAKLIFGHPGFIFIIGLDTRGLNKYLIHVHESRYGNKSLQPESYFEKLIQLPFYIPSNRERMENYIGKLIDSVDLDESTTEVLKPLVSMACNDNPRSAIRMINSCIVDAAVLAHLEINSESVKECVFVNRIMRFGWPSVHEKLSLLGKLCSLVASSIAEESSGEDVLAKASDEERSFIQELSADDDLVAFLKSSSVKNWLRNPEDRSKASSFLKTRGIDLEQRGSKRRGFFDASVQYVFVDSQRDVALQDRVMKIAKDYSNLSVLFIEALHLDPDNVHHPDEIPRKFVMVYDKLNAHIVRERIFNQWSLLREPRSELVAATNRDRWDNIELARSEFQRIILHPTFNEDLAELDIFTERRDQLDRIPE